MRCVVPNLSAFTALVVPQTWKAVRPASALYRPARPCGRRGACWCACRSLGCSFGVVLGSVAASSAIHQIRRIEMSREAAAGELPTTAHRDGSRHENGRLKAPHPHPVAAGRRNARDRISNFRGAGNAIDVRRNATSHIVANSTTTEANGSLAAVHAVTRELRGDWAPARGAGSRPDAAETAHGPSNTATMAQSRYSDGVGSNHDSSPRRKLRYLKASPFKKTSAISDLIWRAATEILPAPSGLVQGELAASQQLQSAQSSRTPSLCEFH